MRSFWNRSSIDHDGSIIHDGNGQIVSLHGGDGSQSFIRELSASDEFLNDMVQDNFLQWILVLIFSESFDSSSGKQAESNIVRGKQSEWSWCRSL